MKAAVIEKPYQVVVKEVDEPSIKSAEIMIKVQATGICRAEIHAYKGTHPYRLPPVISGHEMAGDVVQVGEKVRHFAIGDRVTIEPQIGCGKCIYCLRGYTNLCKEKIILGTREWPGSFAEYITAPEETVFRLPSDISYEEGVLVEPLAVAMHSLRQAKISPRENVIIFGAGTIGLLTLLATRQTKANRIISTDIKSFNLSIAEKLGADAIVNAGQPNYLDNVTGAAGSLDKAIIDTGSANAFRDALQVVRKKGVIVVVGLFEKKLSVDLKDIMLNEKEIRGSLMYVKEDFQEALTLVSSKKTILRSLVTHVLPIEEVEKGFRILEDMNKENVIKVVLKFH
jgi:L-iditol 2-dehydrogenase